MDTKKTSQPVSLPVDGTKEIGTRGEFLVSSYNSEEWRVDDLTLRDYRRMKDNDGQIQMLLSAIVGTLLSAGIKFIDDEDAMKDQRPTNTKPQKIEGKDTKQPEKKEEKVYSEEYEFVKANLTNPRWKNGMSRSMLLTNKTNLRALEEGYRVSEIIYRVDDDGMVRLDRLAPRAARLTDYEMKLITDDNGNYYGFHQLTYFRSGVIDVIVVNDSPIMKTINVVFGEEYGSNYGRPILKAPWYHYDKAHKGMYLNHVGHELGANKFRKVVRKGMTTVEQDNEMLNILAKTSQNGIIIYTEGNYDVIFEDVSDAQVMAVGLDMIKYHTSQMSKALLAQFIDLGSNTSNTGSRSLSDSGKEFFRAGLQYIGQLLIEEPWNKIIADLVKMNFNRGIYPYIKMNEIQDKDVDLLYDSFMELAKQGKLSPKTSQQIEGKTAEQLGLDVTQEEIEEQQEELKEEEESKRIEGVENEKEMLQQKIAAKSNVKLSHLIDEPMEVVPRPMRPLYLDEQKLKLSTIQTRLDTAFTQAQFTLSDKVNTQKDGIINDIIQAVRQGNLNKVTINLADNEMTYSEELNMLALELQEFGKYMASNELGKSVPTSTKADRNGLLTMLGLIISDQVSRLGLRLKLVANKAIQNKLAENDLKMQLSQEYDNFFNTAVPATVGSIVPESFNSGRQIAFNKYNDSIFAYRYTSVLEANTCDYCRELDGKVFQPSDPNYALVAPPNHFNCKCMYSAILINEAKLQNLEVTGKPENLPVYSSLTAFKQI